MVASSRIFVDSNVFIALYNPTDSLHAEALNLGVIFDQQQLSLVISDYIFLEVVTVLAQRRGKIVANQVGDMLLSHPMIHSIHIDEMTRLETWRLFQKLSNKDTSFVDCSIAVIMGNEGIHDLLTFDKKDFKSLQKISHFRIANASDITYNQ